MFDELIREIKKLERQQTISIEVPLDEKGYFDKRCPDGKCHAKFKVLFADWRDKVSDDAAWCPKCGISSPATDFNTPEFNAHMKAAALSTVQEQFGNAMKRATRRSRPRKLNGGLFNISMSLSYKPGRRVPVIPVETEELLRQDVTCDACSCQFATLGSAIFCPACGTTSPTRDYRAVTGQVERTLDAIDELSAVMRRTHDEDAAEDFRRSILEDCVENLVSAFQHCCERLFRSLPNSGDFKCDANLFQRVDDASEKWREASGTGYDDILDATELSSLHLSVQKRHKIGHTQGIVDQRYVDKSGDQSYLPGQKLVIAKSEVAEVCDIVSKLLSGLEGLVEKSKVTNTPR